MFKRRLYGFLQKVHDQKITKTSLYKYTENFTTKKYKFLDKKKNF